MNDEIAALVLAVLLAFAVRFFNVVLAWLARVLGVEPPSPIPGVGAVGAVEAPAPSPAPTPPPDPPTPL